MLGVHVYGFNLLHFLPLWWQCASDICCTSVHLHARVVGETSLPIPANASAEMLETYLTLVPGLGPVEVRHARGLPGCFNRTLSVEWRTRGGTQPDLGIVTATPALGMLCSYPCVSLPHFSVCLSVCLLEETTLHNRGYSLVNMLFSILKHCFCCH